MDPNTHRAEADRWLGIAAKLLTARDFLGSRTFAIRARESDPNNSVSDQILAVVDTVLAGDKRVETTQQPDWYSILQLPRMVRDPDLISTHYRRLVHLLNPDLNRLPFADYALQLIIEAWNVLSDPTKKWLFDNELALSLQRVSSEMGRVDPGLVSGAGSSQLNTFQFFQQPHQETQHQQQPSLPMWQQPPPPPQPPAQQHVVQREFMPPPQQQQQQQQQHVLSQWQMQDPAPVNGVGVTPSRVSVSVSVAHPPPAPTPTPTPILTPIREKVREVNGVIHDANVASINNNNINNNDDGNANNENVVEEDVESFWTACPYCLYIYEYQKVYQDCTLRCQNCKRGFHALPVPNPPPVGPAKGGKGKESFCCWGFFPLGLDVAAWKKSNRVPSANGSSNWVPFSPMFASPGGNGNGNFHWFANDGANNVGGRARLGDAYVSAPKVYIHDEDLIDVSDSDADSSDRDWRNKGKGKRKRKFRRRKIGAGKRIGRPKKVVTLNQGNQDSVDGAGVSIDREDLEDGLGPQEIVVGLSAGKNTDTNKNVTSTNTRKQTRRSMKDVGRLDLNVEFNNEGDEHAPTVSAVNREDDVIENIGFFEGLDEFLSTLPILNVGGDEKPKPS